MNELKLKITVDDVRYYDGKSNWGVFKCFVPKQKGIQQHSIIVKGNTFRLKEGNEYNATLKEVDDKKWGKQYEIVSIFEDVPSDVNKQRGYLESILTKNQVDNIFKAYPDQDIIKLIKEGKFDYNKVHGLGDKNFTKVKNKIMENLEFQAAFEFLSGYGVTNNLIIKLVKHYKSASLLIGTMKENPYAITSVSGVGFKTADAIAMSMNYPPDGEHRIRSAIEYTIQQEEGNGHTYITTSDLLDKIQEIINVDASLVNQYIGDDENYLVLGDKLTLTKTYGCESYVTDRLKELLGENSELNFDPDVFIQKMEEKHGIQMTDQQKSFFHNIKKNRVNLLVGFAGTGKSQMQTFLIELLDELHLRYRLLAPTGRAAKILSNYTNRTGETIHSAIGGGQEDEEASLIEEEFIIVDESSMLDIKLAAKLLSSLNNPNVRILFIGDPEQIPSVGVGLFLHDSIQSGKIPMTMLDIVFRQKEGGILDIATKIRQKKKFLDNDFIGAMQEFGNNCIIASVNQEKMETGYQYFYQKMLEKFSPEDIMVLSPTKKGKLGTVTINQYLQDIMNPKTDQKEIKYGQDLVYRVGDTVMNTKNADMEDVHGKKVRIVNGDIGKIVDINEDDDIVVDFEFTKVPFATSKLDQLLHAWCMTMHKSQGGGAKGVIVIADKAHKFQLNSNLLYTAVTRAKEYLVILSQAETINFAMKKNANLSRNTFLKELLMKEESEE